MQQADLFKHLFFDGLFEPMAVASRHKGLFRETFRGLKFLGRSLRRQIVVVRRTSKFLTNLRFIEENARGKKLIGKNKKRRHGIHVVWRFERREDGEEQKRNEAIIKKKYGGHRKEERGPKEAREMR